MEIRTDLAHEMRERAVVKAKTRGGEIDGVIYSESEGGGIRTSRIEITNENGEREMKRAKGTYVTVFFGDLLSFGAENFGAVCDAAARELREMLGNVGTLLVCGVGNSNITPDSVGPLAMPSVAVTHAVKKSRPDLFAKLGLHDVACVAPGVTAETGIEAAMIVKGAADACGADAVVAIDALCCSDISRLGRTVQLSSVGLSPGSGIGGHSEEISEATVGRRVVGIGVPTIADASAVGETGDGGTAEGGNPDAAGLFVCPQDIDRLAVRLATLCAYSVNKAVNPDMTYAEMADLLQRP